MRSLISVIPTYFISVKGDYKMGESGHNVRPRFRNGMFKVLSVYSTSSSLKFTT
jgi:hypothetical protein